MSLTLEAFNIGPLDNNLYLLLDDATRQAVVIDPSLQSDPARARMQELVDAGWQLREIWNTHGHFDHVYDNARWVEQFQVGICMHEADGFWLQRLREQALWFDLPAPEVITPDRKIAEGDVLTLGEHRVEVLHTPGHSPGSVSFWVPEASWCLCGDVLFRDSVGRTDLAGCSAQQLQESLRRLAELPPATRILPGHGAESTLYRELKHNPFLRL